MERKYYAGIGSRETPPEILENMSSIGAYLEEYGYILRSGGADGADLAFEKMVPASRKEIYLPWKGFNRSTSELYLGNIRESRHTAALQLAEKFHPTWHRLSKAAQKLMTRNSFQIIGQDFIKSDFVVCWTKDGQASGGTGQAIRIANHFGIPVYNLKNALDFAALQSFLKDLA